MGLRHKPPKLKWYSSGNGRILDAFSAFDNLSLVTIRRFRPPYRHHQRSHD
jgi:hypothetical protein